MRKTIEWVGSLWRTGEPELKVSEGIAGPKTRDGIQYPHSASSR